MLQKQESHQISIENSLVINKISEFLSLKELINFYHALRVDSFSQSYLEHTFKKWLQIIYSEYFEVKTNYYYSLRDALSNTYNLSNDINASLEYLSQIEQKAAFLGILYFYPDNTNLINRMFARLPDTYLQDLKFQEIIGRKSYMLLSKISDGVANIIRNDRNCMLKFIEQDSKIYRDLPLNLQHNHDIILRTVSQNGMMIFSVPENLQMQYIKLAIEQNPQVYKFISRIDPLLIGDYSLMEAALSRDGLLLKCVPKAFKKNKYLVKIAVMQNSTALQFATYSVRNCKTFMKELILVKPKAFKYISKRLRNNISLAMIAVNANGMQLKFTEQLINNKDLVAAAILNNTHAFAFAGYLVKDDFEIVSYVMKRNGYFLKYASVRLQNSEQIVRQALETYSQALRFASLNLRDKRDLVRHAIKIDAENFRYGSEWIKNDLELILLAISIKPTVINCAGKFWQDNRNLLISKQFSEEINLYSRIIKNVSDSGDFFIKKQYVSLLEIINKSNTSHEEKLNSIKEICFRNRTLTQNHFFHARLNAIHEEIIDTIINLSELKLPLSMNL